MRLLPTILYRCPGAHFGPPDTTFDYLGVGTEEALEAALVDGWHETLLAAMAPPVVAPEPAPVPADDARDFAPPDAEPAYGDPEPETADNSPVTREELEQKAEDLGIRVDGRWSDKRLIAEIEAKMAAPE